MNIDKYIKESLAVMFFILAAVEIIISVIHGISGHFIAAIMMIFIGFLLITDEK